MDIQYAILGLLDQQAMSGYDLKKLISESDVFYWSGNNNQIYNSLIALHRQGLVEQEIIARELPAKKIYSITGAGRAQLKAWLQSAPELPELRSSLLIRLALADPLSGAELDELLARYGEEVSAQLRMRQARARQSAAQGGAQRSGLLQRKIHEHLAGFYQHELAWIEQTRVELKAEKPSGRRKEPHA